MNKQLSDNQIKAQNNSLMTLSSSMNGQPTKKYIETDQLNNPSHQHSSEKRKYIFHLPLMSDITAILTAITTKFNQDVIHSEEGADGGHILIKGINPQGFRRVVARVVDVLTFCCQRSGVRRGSLEETFNVISIMVKKQIIDNKCNVIINNPYHNSPLHPFFMENVVKVIEKQLKLLGKQSIDTISTLSWINPYTSHSSPTRTQIYIIKRISRLLFHMEGKPQTVFNKNYDKSLVIINQEIQKHFCKLSSAKNLAQKGMLTNPSTIIEKLLKQTQNMMENIYHSFSKQAQSMSQKSFLHTDCQRQISLYSIETAFCLSTLTRIKQIYLLNTKQQCQVFNQQVQYLNIHFSNQQCFQHLQLRGRYRLESEQSPYHSAIKSLQSISLNLSLREMLLTIQRTFSNVKIDCLNANNGKVELSSMDDLLPVMIFVTVRAKIKDFPVYVKLMDDYVRLKQVFQVEERIITTLYVAVEDISKKWIVHSNSEKFDMN